MEKVASLGHYSPSRWAYQEKTDRIVRLKYMAAYISIKLARSRATRRVDGFDDCIIPAEPTTKNHCIEYLVKENKFSAPCKDSENFFHLQAHIVYINRLPLSRGNHYLLHAYWHSISTTAQSTYKRPSSCREGKQYDWDLHEKPWDRF